MGKLGLQVSQLEATSLFNHITLCFNIYDILIHRRIPIRTQFVEVWHSLFNPLTPRTTALPPQVTGPPMLVLLISDRINLSTVIISTCLVRPCDVIVEDLPTPDVALWWYFHFRTDVLHLLLAGVTCWAV